jgi:hypothetical protein
MRTLTRVAARARWPGRLAGVLCASLLAACSSGDGGGSVSPASGQGPDPIVLDFPIAYVKRAVPASDAMNIDARELLGFEPGGDLYVRDRASPSAAERNVTAEITQGKGDVRDVEPSYDGTRLVFAMREPLAMGADLVDPPTWNIWEYDLGTKQLRRVIASDIVADEGHDVAPHYLPDGRIVFSSTRQRQSKAILLDEGKPQFAALDENRNEPAFVRHVMNADGSDIHQVSFNQSHDLDPGVLDDGRIVFSRWDKAPGHDEVSLYTMRPDGSDLALLYGAHSHATGTDDSEVHFLDARPMASGKLLVRTQPFQAPDLGGQLLVKAFEIVTRQLRRVAHIEQGQNRPKRRVRPARTGPRILWLARARSADLHEQDTARCTFGLRYVQHPLGKAQDAEIVVVAAVCNVILRSRSSIHPCSGNRSDKRKCGRQPCSSRHRQIGILVQPLDRPCIQGVIAGGRCFTTLIRARVECKRG